VLKQKECSYDESQATKKPSKKKDARSSDGEEPPKKKRKKSTTAVQPGEIVLLNSPLTQTLVETLPEDVHALIHGAHQTNNMRLSSSTINSLFERMYVTNTLTNPVVAKNVLSYLKAMQNTAVTPITTVPSNDELALYFALKATFLKRFFMKEASQHCFDKARELVSDSFDYMLTNFNLACASSYMGAYLLEENDLVRANFYFNNVRKHLQKHTGQKTAPVRFLEIMSHSGAYFLGKQVNLARIVKGFIYMYYLKKTSDEPIPENRFQALSDDVDISDSTRQRYVLDITLLERIARNANVHYQSIKGTSDMDSISLAIQFTALAYGAKLELGTELSKIQVFEIVNDILALVADPHFKYCHHTTVQALVVAMIRLLEFANTDRLVVVEYCRPLMDGLRKLESKYKFIGARYGETIARVETVLKTSDEHQQFMSVYNGLNAQQQMQANIMANQQNQQIQDLSFQVESPGDSLDSFDDFFLSESEVFNLFSGSDQTRSGTPPSAKPGDINFFL
jgi:hypothetical protein